jgi:hypothetical protein
MPSRCGAPPEQRRSPPRLGSSGARQRDVGTRSRAGADDCPASPSFALEIEEARSHRRARVAAGERIAPARLLGYAHGTLGVAFRRSLSQTRATTRRIGAFHRGRR